MAIKWAEGREFDRDWSAPKGEDGHYPKVFRPTYDGRVVGEHTERGVRIMSDVWADLYYVVVAEDNGEFRSLCYGDSEYCDATVTVDAPAELVAEYEAFRARREAEKAERIRAEREAAAAARLEEIKRRVDRGKRVVVARGRKVPRGTEGEVFWIGPDKFGNGDRIGIRTEDGAVHWTAARNCDVVLDAA